MEQMLLPKTLMKENKLPPPRLCNILILVTTVVSDRRRQKYHAHTGTPPCIPWGDSMPEVARAVGLTLLGHLLSIVGPNYLLRIL